MRKTIIFILLFLFLLSLCFVVSADIDRLDYDTTYTNNLCIDGYGDYIVAAGTGGDIKFYTFYNNVLDVIHVNTSMTSDNVYSVHWYNESTIFFGTTNNIYACFWNGVNISLNASIAASDTCFGLDFDGNTLFAANDDDGCFAYSYDGSSLTYLDDLDLGNARDIMVNTTGTNLWTIDYSNGVKLIRDPGWDGSNFAGSTSTRDDYTNYLDLFVYDGVLHVACDNDGITAFKYDPVFSLQHLDNIDNGTNYKGVYANSSYVFAVLSEDLIIYSFDGSSYSFVDSTNGAGVSIGRKVYCDDTFIYVADLSANVGFTAFVYVPNPDTPTGVNVSYISGVTNRINWTNNPAANSTLVVRKEGSLPDSYTDGTVVYNGTGSTYDFTLSDTVYYYRLFSYSELHGGHAYSTTGADIPDGGINLNCYDANTSTNLTFDIFISNQDGSQVYNATGCNNTFNINMSEVPYGVNTQIIFSSDGYEDQIIYVDVLSYGFYSVNGFLTASNMSNLYYFQVLNTYDYAVEDAKIVVKKYVNETYGFANLSIQYSDGNGFISSHLEPGVLHKIIVSANGYLDQTVDYIPDGTYYGYAYPKVIRLSFDSSEYTNESTYNEVVTFNGFISGSTLYVNFSDVAGLTINTTIRVYQINQTSDSIVLNYTDSRSGDNDFQLSVSGVSDVYSYQVVLWLNHSRFGDVVDSFIIVRSGRNITSTDRFNDLFDLNYGTNPLGWSNIAMFFFMLIGLFSFGERGSGVSLILTGAIILGVNSVIGLNVIGTLLPIVFMVLGILVINNQINRERG